MGAFGTDEYMERVCGDATVAVAEKAATMGASSFVFISAHDYQLPFVLKGYYRGKQKAERAVSGLFPTTGFSLRPAFIHGTRRAGKIVLPLSVVGNPLESVLSNAAVKRFSGYLPFGSALLASPLSVQTVAKAAVVSATEERENGESSVIDIEGIRLLASQF